MNILHIDTEKYWRGGQQQVLYLHQGLIERNINSFLVCNKSSELKKRCKNRNLPYFEIAMLGEIDLLAAYRISRVCKQNSIEIIQAHSAHAVTIGLLIKLFLRNLKLIAVRRVDFSVNKNFLSRLKYNNAKIDIIVCISEFIKKVLLNDEISENKLTIIRSGVDTHKFDSVKIEEDFRQNLGVKKNETLIGTVAAFAGHKDYPNLLRSFSILIRKNGFVKLCIVGDGPLKNDVMKMIDDLDIREKVITTGFKEDIGKYLKSFDIFVLASKKEGLGTSIIDAFSVGLPVVATRTGGIPELIRNEETGILVEPQNPEALSSALLQLINDPVRRDKLGKNALTDITRYSIEKTVEENILLYSKLLENN